VLALKFSRRSHRPRSVVHGSAGVEHAAADSGLYLAQEANMKQFSNSAMVVLTVLCIVCLSSIAQAAQSRQYTISAISHIYVPPDGRVLIKWSGSPRPGPCGGENWGYVAISKAANEALKAFALSLYFSGKPARIDTEGCDSENFENVAGIVSPPE
jgi:hypothetical protein